MFTLLKRLLNSLAPSNSSRRFHAMAEDDSGNKIVYKNNLQQFRGRYTEQRQRLLNSQFRTHIRKEYQQLVTEIILIELIVNDRVVYRADNIDTTNDPACISETDTVTAHTKNTSNNNN